MNPSLKAIALALSLGAGVTLAATAGLLLDARPAAAQDAREAAARELINEALPASRVPEIYEDLRVTVRDIWLPVMRDAASGKIPGGMLADPKMAEIMNKLITFMSYGSKATDEADSALKSNRDAIITDVSQTVAKHFTADEISNIRGALRLTAARKGFDVLYASSRLATGFTYEETRSAQEFSGWAQNLAMQLTTGGAQPQVPTQDKIAKAQAIVAEIQRVGRFDEMMAEGMRFARDVVLKTLPMDQQEAVRLQIDQFEFQYNLQKSMVLAAAPSGIASVLKDEDIDKLAAYVKSPAFSKLFALVYATEKSITTFTVQDITAARTYFEDLEKSGKIRQRTEDEKKAFETDMQALSAKWSDKLMAAVSPDTRNGLMQSLAELQKLDEAQVPALDAPAKPM